MEIIEITKTEYGERREGPMTSQTGSWDVDRRDQQLNKLSLNPD